ACAAIIRHCLDGRRPAEGGGSATGELELTDYDKLFARRAIYSGSREMTAATAALPLYRRLLGDAYQSLPAPLGAMHNLTGSMTAAGVATVTRGKGFLARIAAALIGLPRAGENLPPRVAFRSEHGRERSPRRV